MIDMLQRKFDLTFHINVLFIQLYNHLTIALAGLFFGILLDV